MNRFRPAEGIHELAGKSLDSFSCSLLVDSLTETLTSTARHLLSSHVTKPITTPIMSS